MITSIPTTDTKRARMAYPAHEQPWRRACDQPRRTFQHGTRVIHRDPGCVGLRGIVEPGPLTRKCHRLSRPFDGTPQVHIRWTHGRAMFGTPSGWYDVADLVVATTPPGVDLVAAGAALLDEREPGWYKLVDLGELDMSCPFWCLLAQTWTGPRGVIASPYAQHCEALFPGDDGTLVCAYGFDAVMDDGAPSAQELEAAWENEILARRGVR